MVARGSAHRSSPQLGITAGLGHARWLSHGRWSGNAWLGNAWLGGTG
jgi:hypothetical protein